MRRIKIEKNLSPKESKINKERNAFFINYNNYDDKSKTAEGLYKNIRNY